MKVLIGLGNPENKYLSTRHNVGWQFLDYLAKKNRFPEFQEQKKFYALIARKDDVWLIKPTTYMNDSGRAVRSFLHFYQSELLQSSQTDFKNVAVIHDDLDIPIGGSKLQFGSGPKVHNGINSIRDHLKTDQFWYGRVGVDGREGKRSEAGKDYVLQPFFVEEKEKLVQVFAELAEKLKRELKLFR